MLLFSYQERHFNEAGERQNETEREKNSEYLVRYSAEQCVDSHRTGAHHPVLGAHNL